MKILQHLRQKRPLVHCITNYVTVNDVANALLSVGASPVMADDESEVDEITAISNALLINIGTLNSRTISSMIKSAKKANELKIPIVFDPVGVGASTLRNETAFRLLEQVNFTLIRANASEISFLANKTGGARGVDANEHELEKDMLEHINTAKILSKKYNCIVAVSGKTDIIVDEKQTKLCNNGSPMMANITGSGCMLGAVMAAFLGASDDKFEAALKAICTFGISGEMAAEKTMANHAANATFRTNFIDALSFVDDDILNKRARILKH
ncbi:hydroxyethylthiazole kinase [Campylobacter sp. 9BO]|uniref:hydroxyethylthiazole kinase n=1 Tax=Campylobacter sp. 9BO TaxID=3424759 RepID=UPI003D34554F